MPRKLPKYVQAFSDRHDKPRFYFRRTGFSRIPLPGLPWTPSFMAAYGEALESSNLAASKAAGNATKKREKSSTGPAKPGSFAALIAEYRKSSGYGVLADSTKKTYDRLLDRLERSVGTLPVARMTSAHVERMMDQRAAQGGPEAGNNLRRILRLLLKLAVRRNYRTDNPMLGIEKIARPKGAKKGHRTLSEADISQFIKKYPLGTREYLALALLLCTGQRRSDVVKIGPKNIIGKYDPTDFKGRQITLMQKKTGKELVLPIAPMLEEALSVAAVPARSKAFLRANHGGPFTPQSFTNKFSLWAKKAGIKEQASPHTLRKAAARRLAEAGCTVHMIMSVTGHDSIEEVELYTKAAGQQALARAAIERLQNPMDLNPAHH